ncbi:hypothetical protein NC796_15480 [Aliifodinibius sp. S!AR15-10]|uniref:TolB family protein n=1 Tax=Aliifodinibius sp. S!AR15-10 TaxID=2950437 RepID=UPI00285730E0|nr:DUF5050 domain-containing protein [Aliifodinibius sp. S!AR15-10]MDR8392556.1 hypothetical protein [Aliifodinibius sp. S!AR15-10]
MLIVKLRSCYLLVLLTFWLFANVETICAQAYTPDGRIATGPYWSPDGQKLAFSASYSGNYDVYIVNLSDDSMEQITDHPANDLYPAWSPTGRNIAFYSDRESTVPPHPPDTIVYKIKGLYETYARDGYLPNWSPDGRTILAHLRSERGNYEIYKMNRRGRDRQPLTWNDASDLQPRFSPDGKRIVFVSGRDYQPEIYVMNADGTEQTRLTYSPAYNLDPVWSPDGKNVAYISNESGFFDIWVMNSDGKDKRKLTDNPSYDISPVWSPDGNQILFSSDRGDGGFDLFIMDSDGENIRRLTYDEGNEYCGAWSPDGRKVAYLSTQEGETRLFMISTDGTGQELVSN